MTELTPTEKEKFIRDHIQSNVQLFYDILKCNYGHDNKTVKKFDNIIEKADIKVFWGMNATIEEKIQAFLHKCIIEFDINIVYSVFSLFSDDCENETIIISFWYIHNILYGTDTKTKWDAFFKLHQAVLNHASKFLKVKIVRQALTLLNKRTNCYDLCSVAPPCQLYNHIIQTAQGIRQFDKSVCDILYLMEMLRSIYEQIVLVYEQKNQERALCRLNSKIHTLYDDTISYILVTAPDKVKDINQQIGNLLKNASTTPMMHSIIDDIMRGLNLIYEKCDSIEYAIVNKEESLKAINGISEKIPSIIKHITEHIQADLEFSSLALNQKIAPIEIKEKKPTFLIAERLIPRDWPMNVEVADG